MYLSNHHLPDPLHLLERAVDEIDLGHLTPATAQWIELTLEWGCPVSFAEVFEALNTQAATELGVLPETVGRARQIVRLHRLVLETLPAPREEMAHG